MYYRFLLNISQPGNYSFFEKKSGLFLNYEQPLSAVEELNGRLERAVLFHKIIDLDNAYPDINDNLSEANKNIVAALINKFNITDDTKYLLPINSINNEIRDQVPPPFENKETAKISAEEAKATASVKKSSRKKTTTTTDSTKTE